MLFTLLVVFVLLATTGWTTLERDGGTPGPRTAALLAWKRGALAGRPLPSSTASAGRIAAYFAALTAGQRHRLAKRYPLVVGNLDGAPVELRYRANRTALAQAREIERRRTHNAQLTELGRQQAERRMRRLTSLLRADRQILAFDPTGRGRVAEVFGDLTTADRVSIVVPGADTELLTFERSERWHTSPVGMARALSATQEAKAPGRTATVAWADYTAPRGLGVDAASGALARDGAARLVRFVTALPGHSRVALFCHSYGSVACGVAAHVLPPRVTDIAVAGSPGMRADDRGALGTRARVWAMRGAGDWIAGVPHMEFGGLGHGADPMEPAFGARRLSAGRAPGHAGYFVPGTASLVNLAAVGTGLTRGVVCAVSDPQCGRTDGRA